MRQTCSSSNKKHFLIIHASSFWHFYLKLFLRIASLEICAYGSISLNQLAPIKLTLSLPSFWHQCFFLCVFT